MVVEWEMLLGLDPVVPVWVAVLVTMPVQTAMLNLVTMLNQATTLNQAIMLSPVIRLSQRQVLDQKADSVLVMVLAVVAEEVWEALEVVAVLMSMR